MVIYLPLCVGTALFSTYLYFVEAGKALENSTSKLQTDARSCKPEKSGV